MSPPVVCADVKKPTQAEILEALRSVDSSVRDAMAARITQKRPKHRPAKPTAPYNRAALLDVFFSFLKNADDVNGLRAGVMPIPDLPFDPEYADELIQRLSPVAAKSAAAAMRMTVDWFAKHGVTVTVNTIKKAYSEYLQRDGEITTPADWENFKQKSSEVTDRN